MLKTIPHQFKSKAQPILQMKAMMEQVLHCNNQRGGYCRTPLTLEAVVTTCSHIFCVSCAQRIGLFKESNTPRTCPVCPAVLSRPDDIVQMNLHPSDDYKTSVLSGLHPATIMECANRALAFWTYQTTQEIVYQQHVVKKVTEKYSNLNKKTEELVREANTEITSLHTKLAALVVEQQKMQQKYAELAKLRAEENVKLAENRQMYAALKEKYQLSFGHPVPASTPKIDIPIMDQRPPHSIMDQRPPQSITAVWPTIQRDIYTTGNKNGVEQLHSYQRSGGSESFGKTRIRMTANRSNIPLQPSPMRRVLRGSLDLGQYTAPNHFM